MNKRFTKIFISVLVVMAVVICTMPVITSLAEEPVYNVRVGIKVDGSNSTTTVAVGSEGVRLVNALSEEFTTEKGATYYATKVPAGEYEIVLGDETSEYVADIVSITKNYTITYKFFSLSFDPNGGAFDDETTEPKVVCVQEGQDGTVPDYAVTKKDYTLIGWQNGETVVEAGDAITGVTEKATYTAVWKPDAIYGDVNGDTVVDTKDLVRLKKKLAGQDVEYNELNSDCNGDTVVDTKDLVRLKKKLAGQDVILGPAVA